MLKPPVKSPTPEMPDDAALLMRVDLAGAVLALLLVATLFVVGAREAAGEVARAGRNVDSGAYSQLVAMVFLFPSGLLLLGAAAALRVGQWWGYALSVLGWAWPLLVLALLRVYT